MKKTTVLALVCMMCLSVWGCDGGSDKENVEPVTESAAVTETEKVYEEPVEIEDPSLSEIADTETITNPQGWRAVHEKNKNGDSVRITVYTDKNKVYYEYNYAYNSDGRVIFYTLYSQSYDTTERTEYFYDENGNLIKEAYYGSKGKDEPQLRSFDRFEYDENNNLITKTEYGVNRKTNVVDAVQSVYKYEYDADGRMTKETRHYANGNIDEWTEYLYESGENPSESVRHNSNGMVLGRCEYEYDGNGNKIKETDYDADNNYVITEYYENGEKKNEKSYYVDGEIRYEYNYDEYGNKIE